MFILEMSVSYCRLTFSEWIACNLSRRLVSTTRCVRWSGTTPSTSDSPGETRQKARLGGALLLNVPPCSLIPLRPRRHGENTLRARVLYEPMQCWCWNPRHTGWNTSYTYSQTYISYKDVGGDIYVQMVDKFAMRRGRGVDWYSAT